MQHYVGMKRCNFKQDSNGLKCHQKCQVPLRWQDTGMPFFLSFSSAAWFFKFSWQLKGPARLRPARCNGSGAIIKTATSDSPLHLHLRLSSDYGGTAFPLPAALLWPADKLCVISPWRPAQCGPRVRLLCRPLLWSPVCSSSDKIVELRRSVKANWDKPFARWLLSSETGQKVTKIVMKVSLVVCFPGWSWFHPWTLSPWRIFPTVSTEIDTVLIGSLFEI